ncbi:hypothetical protein B5S28_g2301 [[Candida] boidinii]|nr:hypothetical protein B5S28_g2301 [[Candida] boidinii]OWB62357.1 hypothetical protein B5S29_g3281 [[Candida] boidinii]
MATNSSQESFESIHSAIFDKEAFEMPELKSPRVRPSSCRFTVENSDTDSDTHSESASTTKFPESVKSIVSSKAQSDRFIQQPVFRIISREALDISSRTYESLSKSVSISSLQQQQQQQNQQQQQPYGSQIVKRIPSSTDSFSISSMSEKKKQFNTQNTTGTTTAPQNKQFKIATYQNKNDMRRGNYNYSYNYNYHNKSMYPRNIRGVYRSTNHNRSSSTNRTSNNNSDADYVLNVDLKSSDESLVFNSDDFKSEASSSYSQTNKQKNPQGSAKTFFNQAGYEKYLQHSQDDLDDIPSFKQKNIKIRNSMRQSSGSQHHSRNLSTKSAEQQQQHSIEADSESSYSHSQTSYSNKSNKKVSNRSISSLRERQRVIVLPGINESGTDFQVLVVPETLDYKDYPSSPGSEYDLSKFQNSSKNGTSTTLNNIRNNNNNNNTSTTPLGGSISGRLSVSTGSVIPFNTSSRSSSLRRKASVVSKHMKDLEKETKRVNRRKPPVYGDESSIQEKLKFKSTLRDSKGINNNFKQKNNKKEGNNNSRGGIFLKRSNATRRKVGWLSTLVGVLKMIETRCKSSWRKLKNRYNKRKLFKFKNDTIIRRNSKSSSNYSPPMTTQRDTSSSYSVFEPKPWSFMKLKRGSSITSRNSNSSNTSKTSNKRKLSGNSNRSKESLSRLSSFSYSKSITRRLSGNKYHRKPIEFENREIYNIDELESSGSSESFRKKLIQNSKEAVPFKLQKLDNYLDDENQKLVERVNERKVDKDEIDILKRRGFVGVINDDSSDLESQLSKHIVKLINSDPSSSNEEVGLNQLWNHYLKNVVANRIEMQLKIQKRLSGDYDKIKSKSLPKDNNNQSSGSSRREEIDEAIDSIASFKRKDSVLHSGTSKISKISKTSTDSFLDIIIAGDKTMVNSTGVYDTDSLSNSLSGASSITCSTVSSSSGSSGSEDGGNEEYENDSDFFGNSVVSSSVNSDSQYTSSILASSNDYGSVILPRVAVSSNRFTIPKPQLSSGISSSRSSQTGSVRYYNIDEAGDIRSRSIEGRRRTEYGVNRSNSGGIGSVSGGYLASPDSVSFYGPKSSAIRNSIFSADTVTQTYFPIIIRGGQDNLSEKKYGSDRNISGGGSESRKQGINEEEDEDSDSDFNDIIEFHSNNDSSSLEDLAKGININNDDDDDDDDEEEEEDDDDEEKVEEEKIEHESDITNTDTYTKTNPGRISRSTSSFARGFNRMGKMKTRNYLTRKQDLSFSSLK